jgi:alcohol dehydrogenase
MEFFDFQTQTRVIFGNGALEQLGRLASELGFHKTLLVADSGLVACGHVQQATNLLTKAGIEVIPFHDFEVNPDTRMIEAGRAFAAPLGIDSIIGLGGGSSLDCAKGINFLLTNGGRMQDYLGYGRATQPMLPMIGIPTTTGTGSEAQSYALISDAETHIKMACGSKQAAFRIALLDPALTISQPRHITATAGFDALAHAVETFVTTKRNPLSEVFSREAWRLLEANYERVLIQPSDIEARGAMQLGAFYAGMAIENSMLGATHACANPLTARYGTEHGVAIALMLPTVVRWNTSVVEDRYRELLSLSLQSHENDAGKALALRLEELKEAGELPARLSAIDVPRAELQTLAAEAAEQWTGRFNPRQFDRHGAEEIYEWAY